MTSDQQWVTSRRCHGAAVLLRAYRGRVGLFWQNHRQSLDSIRHIAACHMEMCRILQQRMYVGIVCSLVHLIRLCACSVVSGNIHYRQILPTVNKYLQTRIILNNWPRPLYCLDLFNALHVN